MHPAFSVIFFTVASGAGFGLMAVAAGLSGLGGTRLDTRFVLAIGVLALLLAGFGLLSSLLHLGRPLRAWRAVSQWRSSWLSREGVLALLTMPVAALFFLGWAFFDWGAWLRLLGGSLLLLTGLTVFATAMIYRSLKPVRQWHHPLVPPIYLLLALMSGQLAWNAVATPLGLAVTSDGWVAAALCLAGLGLKLGYWHSIDRQQSASTIASATGLGRHGVVRAFDPPHTSENYLQAEMGYRVARKHAVKLRRIALLLGFVLPAGLSLAVPTFAAIPAFVLGLLGLFVERWLFFAEATHTAMLYYGADGV